MYVVCVMCVLCVVCHVRAVSVCMFCVPCLCMLCVLWVCVLCVPAVCAMCMHVVCVCVCVYEQAALICKKDNLRCDFEENYPLWAQAVVKYCKDTQIKCTSLQSETEKYSDDLTGGTFIHIIHTDNFLNCF